VRSQGLPPGAAPPPVDHRRVGKSDLSALYASRYNIDLDLRNLKTTISMNVLRCQRHRCTTSSWGHLLAYNVIRMLIAGCPPRGRAAAKTELQAHGTTVESVDFARTVGDHRG